MENQARNIVRRYAGDSTPRHFTGPDGHPLVYLTESLTFLCPDCAARAEDDPDEDDKPTIGDIYWEGPTLACESCGRKIDSVHGIPCRPG